MRNSDACLVTYDVAATAGLVLLDEFTTAGRFLNGVQVFADNCTVTPPAAMSANQSIFSRLHSAHRDRQREKYDNMYPSIYLGRKPKKPA